MMSFINFINLLSISFISGPLVITWFPLSSFFKCIKIFHQLSDETSGLGVMCCNTGADNHGFESRSRSCSYDAIKKFDFVGWIGTTEPLRGCLLLRLCCFLLTSPLTPVMLIFLLLHYTIYILKCWVLDVGDCF